MELKHSETATKGAFEAFDKETQIGEMTYSRAGDSMIIVDHTYVDEAYRGQNIARQLFDAMVKHARNNNLKVKPLCPYVKKVMDKEAAQFEDIRG